MEDWRIGGLEDWRIGGGLGCEDQICTPGREATVPTKMTPTPSKLVHPTFGKVRALAGDPREHEEPQRHSERREVEHEPSGGPAELQGDVQLAYEGHAGGGHVRVAPEAPLVEGVVFPEAVCVVEVGERHLCEQLGDHQVHERRVAGEGRQARLVVVEEPDGGYPVEGAGEAVEECGFAVLCTEHVEGESDVGFDHIGGQLTSRHR